MKKLISLVLSCVMLLSLSTSAFAANSDSDFYVRAYVMSAEETVEMFAENTLFRYS